jgi:hypothetical protein
VAGPCIAAAADGVLLGSGAALGGLGAAHPCRVCGVALVGRTCHCRVLSACTHSMCCVVRLLLLLRFCQRRQRWGAGGALLVLMGCADGTALPGLACQAAVRTLEQQVCVPRPCQGVWAGCACMHGVVLECGHCMACCRQLWLLCAAACAVWCPCVCCAGLLPPCWGCCVRAALQAWGAWWCARCRAGQEAGPLGSPVSHRAAVDLT